MTKLGYSNRGGRGGGRFHHGARSGRGVSATSARGRGAAAKKWVRPKRQEDNDDNEGNGAEYDQQQGSTKRAPIDDTEDTLIVESSGNNATAKGVGSGESTATTSTTRPILRGPRSQNFHQHRGGGRPGHNAIFRSNRGRGRSRNITWHQESNISDSEQTTSGEDLGESTSSLEATQTKVPPIESSNTDRSSTNSIPAEQQRNQQEQMSRRKVEDDDSKHQEVTTEKDQASQTHARRGAHSLVLLTRRSASSDAGERAPTTITAGDNTGTTTDASHNMVHKGSNKLVLLTRRKAGVDGNPKEREDDNSIANELPKNHPPTRIESHRGGRRMRGGISNQNVKRIKLSPPPLVASIAHRNGSYDDEGEEPQDKPTISEQVNETKGKRDSKETWTDFAYRQTSSNRGRGGRFVSGRGRGRGRQHMGLVRVVPDEATTPICPTFLRGVRCEDERCVKRHDVPKEYAMPVCSFFQRHGQCLKGSECQFRHVKVNPRATLCPSFQLLGFCNDEKCLMQHVKPNPSSKPTSNHGNNKYQRSPASTS